MRMKLLASGKRFAGLALLSVVCVVVYALLRLFNQNTYYDFLIWNLFLAWIPYVLSSVAAILHERSTSVPRLALTVIGIVWILFFAKCSLYRNRYDSFNHFEKQLHSGRPSRPRFFLLERLYGHHAVRLERPAAGRRFDAPMARDPSGSDIIAGLLGLRRARLVLERLRHLAGTRIPVELLGLAHEPRFDRAVRGRQPPSGGAVVLRYVRLVHLRGVRHGLPSDEQREARKFTVVKARAASSYSRRKKADASRFESGSKLRPPRRLSV